MLIWSKVDLAGKVVELGMGRFDMEMDKKFHVFLGVVGK